MIASGSTGQVLDAHTGAAVGKPLQHRSGVTAAQFSPDGMCIVTASDRIALVWDARTAVLIGKPLVHRGTVNSVQFSPDGRRIVTASEDHTARLWEAPSGTDKPLPDSR
jgi:WD40 repeat protein